MTSPAGLGPPTRPALPTSEIDQALKSDRWWRLRLPGGLDREFNEEALEQRVLHTVRSGWLALLVFDSFLLVDWLMARDVFWFGFVVRLLAFTPLGIITLMGVHRHRGAIKSLQWPQLVDWVTLLSGWGAAVCLALILLKSQSPLAMYYHAGFLVVMIYGTLVQRIRTVSAATFILGILALDALCAAYGHLIPMPLRIAMMELLIVCGAFCMVATVSLERAQRRRYLLLRRENGLSESLLAVNMQLQQLSRADVLTGVANRRHFHEYMQQVWERALKDRRPVSVLMLDVDHFKLYNDRYGHPEGDECLRQVAQSITQSLRRPDDFVARYGGEEFVAVLPYTNLDMAVQAAERVRERIQALSMRHESSATDSVVTVSIGVSTVIPGDQGMTPDKLLNQADRALYEAKRTERNRVCVFDA